MKQLEISLRLPTYLRHNKYCEHEHTSFRIAGGFYHRNKIITLQCIINNNYVIKNSDSLNDVDCRGHWSTGYCRGNLASARQYYYRTSRILSLSPPIVFDDDQKKTGQAERNRKREIS